MGVDSYIWSEIREYRRAIVTPCRSLTCFVSRGVGSKTMTQSQGSDDIFLLLQKVFALTAQVLCGFIVFVLYVSVHLPQYNFSHPKSSSSDPDIPDTPLRWNVVLFYLSTLYILKVSPPDQ